MTFVITARRKRLTAVVVGGEHQWWRECLLRVDIQQLHAGLDVEAGGDCAGRLIERSHTAYRANVRLRCYENAKAFLCQQTVVSLQRSHDSLLRITVNARTATRARV